MPSSNIREDEDQGSSNSFNNNDVIIESENNDNKESNSNSNSIFGSRNIELYPHKQWFSNVISGHNEANQYLLNETMNASHSQHQSQQTNIAQNQQYDEHHQQIRLPKEIPSGITSNGKWAYLYNDNEIFIYDTHTGIRITTFCFMDQKHEMIVTAVSDLKINNAIYLVAAVMNQQQQGVLKILDCQHGLLLRTINVGPVISRIVQFEPTMQEESILLDSVSKFRVPVALGLRSAGPAAMLVDLYFNTDDRSLQTTSRIYTLKQIADIQQFNEDQFWESTATSRSSIIPYAAIGANYFDAQHRFEYPSRSPTEGMVIRDGITHHHSHGHQHEQDQKVLIAGNAVYVSSIAYFPSIHVIAVGYSIGVFQFFSSDTFELTYCSPVKEFAHRVPVTHFLLQELEDDPDSPSSYLWVGRGANSLSAKPDQTVSIVLYKIDFIKAPSSSSSIPKNIITLQNVTNQQLDIAKVILPNGSDQSLSGNILYQAYFHTAIEIESELENGNLPPRSKSIFIYQLLDPTTNQPRVHIKLFDLFLFERLSKDVSEIHKCLYEIPVSNSFNNDNQVSACWINSYSISRRILARQLVNNEEDDDDMIEPISVAHSSFDLLLVLDGASITSHTYYNPQDRAIDFMSKNGFLSFVDPQPVYDRFLEAKIFVSPKDISQQRSSLIYFSLENNMFSLIIDYIQSNTISKDYHGNDNISYFLSNPKLILDLTWDYFEHINNKLNFSEIFSQSGDERSRQRLGYRLETIYLRMLDCFHIFESLCDRYKTEYKTEEVTPYLQSKYDTILASAQHLEIVKWVAVNGLFGTKMVTILENIPTIASNERKLLKDFLSGSNLQFNQKDELLLIDMIFDDMEINESYPPSTSIQLKRFLDLFQTKKFTKLLDILYYFLLDMDLIEQLPFDLMTSLSSTFFLPQSHIDFMTGIWYLDSAALVEADIQESANQAYSYLSGSSKKSKKYAYWILLRFFVLGAHKQALLFMKSVGFDPKDIKEATLSLKILLANNCLVESLLLERNFRKKLPSLEPAVTEPLMHLICEYCTKKRQLDKLMQMPLDDFEDQCFIHYLYKINAAAMVPLYMIRRGRVAEGCTNFNQISRNLTGLEGLKAIIANNELTLPFEQRCSNPFDQNQLNQQQIVQPFEDIPDLPRSVSKSQRQQPVQQQNNLSFIYQPVILDKQPVKMFTNTMNLDAKSLDTDSFRDFIKKSTLPQYKTPTYIQPTQQPQQPQQQPSSLFSFIDDEMKETEEEEEEQVEEENDMMLEEEQQQVPRQYFFPMEDQSMKDNLFDQGMGEQEEIEEEVEEEEEDILRTPSPIQQESRSPSTTSSSSNSTQESPVASPTVWQPLKSALKVKGTPSKKNRVNIQEALNIEYPIETKEERIYQFDEDDDDDYDNMHFADVNEEEEEEEDDEDYDEDDEDEDIYNVGTRGYGQKNLSMMADFDDDDDDDEAYEEEDDMIIHQDVPEQRPLFASRPPFMGGYPKEYEEEEEEEEYDSDFDEDEEERYMEQKGGTEDEPLEILDSDDEPSPPSQAQSRYQQEEEEEEMEEEEEDDIIDEDYIEEQVEEEEEESPRVKEIEQEDVEEAQQVETQQSLPQQQDSIETFMDTDNIFEATQHSVLQTQPSDILENSTIDENTETTVDSPTTTFQLDTSEILQTPTGFNFTSTLGQNIDESSIINTSDIQDVESSTILEDSVVSTTPSSTPTTKIQAIAKSEISFDAESSYFIEEMDDDEDITDTEQEAAKVKETKEEEDQVVEEQTTQDDGENEQMVEEQTTPETSTTTTTQEELIEEPEPEEEEKEQEQPVQQQEPEDEKPSPIEEEVEEEEEEVKVIIAKPKKVKASKSAASVKPSKQPIEKITEEEEEAEPKRKKGRPPKSKSKK